MSDINYDFVQRNGTWLLSVMGVMATCTAGLFSFLLKSRCSKIKCCGLECDRQPIDITAADVGTPRVPVQEGGGGAGGAPSDTSSERGLASPERVERAEAVVAVRDRLASALQNAAAARRDGV
jgi:hypothetical protein